jgi:type I restriction enzyme S subunit
MSKRKMDKNEITKENLSGFFESLHNLLWNRAGLNPDRALEHLTFFFAYRMIEPQIDSLGLPKECKWSYLAGIKQGVELSEEIKRGVVAFRQNPSTKPFFKPHEIQKTELIYDIVQQINRISPELLNETDTLGDIFEYMLGRGMGTMADEGQYFTNRKICKVAFDLAFEIKKTLRRPDGSLCTFADWFCGTGGFAAEYIKGVKENLEDVDWKKDFESIYCQDMNLSSVTTTLLNLLILTGIPFNNNKIRSSNSFADPITDGNLAPYKDLKIDYCFMNPPYGGDKTKGKEYRFAYSKKVKNERGKFDKHYYVNKEIQRIGIEDDDKVSAGVQLGMATLNDEGVCCIVLPQGFFFGAGKKVVELRKKLIEEYAVYAVIDIDSGEFENTTTKTSMLVFQKGVGQTDEVTFMNLERDEYTRATIEQIREKKYSLNYKQYIDEEIEEIEGFEIVKLGDICEIESGEYITKATAPEGEYPVYGGGDLSFYTSKYNRENKFVIAKDGMSAKCVRYVYGKFHLNHHGWTFKTNERANYSYIGYWLLNNQDKLYNLAVGTAQKGINQTVFYNIQIPLPSIERQNEIVESIDSWADLQNQYENLLKTLEKKAMQEVLRISRGKPKVKLGHVCEWQMGKRIVKVDAETGDYPVYGGGDISFFTNVFNRSDINCKISREGISEKNCVLIIYGNYYQNSQGMTVNGKNKEIINDSYIYYWLLKNKEKVYNCGHGTAQKAIYMPLLNDIKIPLPPIEEQNELEELFNDIKHAYEKIESYKKKKQEAIEKNIPGSTK